MKTVYVAMCADLIHHGHINIIKEARGFGEVIIGLLTDEAISSYKEAPLLNYSQRKEVIDNIMGIYTIVPQRTLDYTDNLKEFKPDYVVHGDDWKTGVQKKTRDKVVKTLKAWGGELIDVQYTEGISSTKLKKTL